MRKRRRLVNKIMTMSCAVMVAVSAFFYVSMDVHADEIGLSVDISPDDLSALTYEKLNELSFDVSQSGNVTLDSVGYYDYALSNSETFFMANNLNDDSVYQVDYSYVLNISHNYNGNYLYMSPCIVQFEGFNLFNSRSLNIIRDYSFSYSDTIYLKGSTINDGSYFRYLGTLIALEDTEFTINFDIDFSVDSISEVSSVSSDEYQNGYNAGYSDGERDGYDNGYSQGFLNGEESGFISGVESVDTDSFFDAGYEAGYNQAYSIGYDNGFEAGRDSVMLSKGQWGESVFLGDALNYNLSGSPFYVSSYGLIDMEEYQSGQNGYFYNTVPGTFSGYTDYNFTIPFSTLNNGTMFRIDSDKFEIDFRLSNLRTYLNPNSASATLSANLYNSKIVEAYVTYNGTKFYGQIHNDDDVDFHFQVDSFSDVNWLNDSDMSVTIKVQNNVCLVTDSDISLYVGCEYTPKLLFTLGPPSLSYAVMVRPYYGSDNVSANIQNQTDKLNENSNKNTNSIINGFNNSKGESVNSDLSAGLNEFQMAEDSLFSTASSSLSDYQFFNLSSVPAMVTGISFVSSIMTSWFNQAGGTSGVGIVLSILFSIMLVAMVLGLYRWYQSKGGKD